MTAKEERTFQITYPWPLNLILYRRQKAENETILRVLSRGSKDSKVLVKWAEEALEALETRLGTGPYFGGQKCDPSSFLNYRNFVTHKLYQTFTTGCLRLCLPPSVPHIRSVVQHCGKYSNNDQKENFLV